MTMTFKERELVWARMDGYPFWPARIASESIAKQLKAFRNAEGIVVLFFGVELTYGIVPEEDVKEFDTNFIEYSRAKSRKSIKVDFETALEMARKSNTIEDPPLELDMEQEEDDVAMNKVEDATSSDKKTNNDANHDKVAIPDKSDNVENETESPSAVMDMNKAVPETESNLQMGDDCETVNVAESAVQNETVTEPVVANVPSVTDAEPAVTENQSNTDTEQAIKRNKVDEDNATTKNNETEVNEKQVLVSDENLVEMTTQKNE